ARRIRRPAPVALPGRARRLTPLHARDQHVPPIDRDRPAVPVAEPRAVQLEPVAGDLDPQLDLPARRLHARERLEERAEREAEARANERGEVRVADDVADPLGQQLHPRPELALELLAVAEHRRLGPPPGATLDQPR